MRRTSSATACASAGGSEHFDFRAVLQNVHQKLARVGERNVEHIRAVRLETAALLRRATARARPSARASPRSAALPTARPHPRIRRSRCRAGAPPSFSVHRLRLLVEQLRVLDRVQRELAQVLAQDGSRRRGTSCRGRRPVAAATRSARSSARSCARRSACAGGAASASRPRPSRIRWPAAAAPPVGALRTRLRTSVASTRPSSSSISSRARNGAMCVDSRPGCRSSSIAFIVSSAWISDGLNHSPGSAYFGPSRVGDELVAAAIGVPDDRRVEALAHVLEVALERGGRDLQRVEELLARDQLAFVQQPVDQVEALASIHGKFRWQYPRSGRPRRRG